MTLLTGVDGMNFSWVQFFRLAINWYSNWILLKSYAIVLAAIGSFAGKRGISRGATLVQCNYRFHLAACSVIPIIDRASMRLFLSDSSISLGFSRSSALSTSSW